MPDVSRKPIQLRLPIALAHQLELVARAEGKSINATAEDLLSVRIEQLRNDKNFQARLERVLERNREALELLTK